MFQLIPLHLCYYLKKNLMKPNVATDEGNSGNVIWHQRNDGIEVLYKVASEYELNSQPDSSVG